MASRTDKLLTRFNELGTKEIWAARVGEETITIAGADGNAEAERRTNEQARVSSEAARVEVDGLREQRQLKNDEDQRRNNEAAKALAPATTGDIDEILAGRPVEGTRVIDTAALAYLWPKIVEWGTTNFAPAKTV